MRHLLFVAIAAAGLAAPAAASSVETVVKVPAGSGSLMAIGCEHCPPLKPKKEAETYVVPTLAAGKQKIEVIERDGERKLLRTESWMGGSPVVFVSKAPFWDAAPNSTAMAMISEIDHSATTASVEPLDMSDFDLRLN